MKVKKHRVAKNRRRVFVVRAEYSAKEHGWGAFDAALYRAARGWSAAAGTTIRGKGAGVRDHEWYRPTRAAANNLAARLRKVAPQAIRVKVTAEAAS